MRELFEYFELSLENKGRKLFKARNYLRTYGFLQEQAYLFVYIAAKMKYDF